MAAERSIVVGLEDSDEGRDALALGAGLAEALNARPLLATAVALPEGALTAEELERAVEAETADLFDEAREQLADVDPDLRGLASASAAHTLHDLAESESALALVLGSTHRGPVGRVLPGSTAERLLHGAPCGVAVAARGLAARGRARLLHMAVAFDGSGEAAVALRVGVGLAQRCNASLAVYTVTEPPGFGAATTPAGAPTAEQQSYRERQARETLDAGLSRVPPDLPVTGQLLHGDPESALIDVSADHDLLVVGSRGHGPLRRTLLGSTTRRLFNGAHCSVLALPRGVEADPYLAPAAD
jgi:nucleotide-binding universal stress UspA family protein